MPRPPKLTANIIDDVHEQEQFIRAIDKQHRVAVRTATDLLDIRLQDMKGVKKSELSDYPHGKVDPQIQLLLIARDNFEKAEEPTERTVFFKEMRSVLQTVDDKCRAILDMMLKERHHQENLQLMKEKLEIAKKSKEMIAVEAELEQIAQGVDLESKEEQ